jgi:hypothetical protein
MQHNVFTLDADGLSPEALDRKGSRAGVPQEMLRAEESYDISMPHEDGCPTTFQGLTLTRKKVCHFIIFHHFP